MTGTGTSVHTYAARCPAALGRAAAGRQVDVGGEPLAVAHGPERAEVQARAEVRSLAGQDHGPDPGLGLEPLARGDQAGEHRPVQGVALLRPGEADIGDAVGDRHADSLLGHVGTSRSGSYHDDRLSRIAAIAR